MKDDVWDLPHAFKSIYLLVEKPNALFFEASIQHQESIKFCLIIVILKIFYPIFGDIPVATICGAQQLTVFDKIDFGYMCLC